MTLLGIGFVRLYTAALPDGTLPAPFTGSDTEVALHNPHTARSVLAIDGAPIGEAPPRGCVVVRELALGLHRAVWTTPAGFSRAAPFEATAPLPARSSPPCGR